MAGKHSRTRSEELQHALLRRVLVAVLIALVLVTASRYGRAAMTVLQGIAGDFAHSDAGKKTHR